MGEFRDTELTFTGRFVSFIPKWHGSYVAATGGGW